MEFFNSRPLKILTILFVQHTAMRPHIKAHMVPLCLNSTAHSTLCWDCSCINLLPVLQNGLPELEAWLYRSWTASPSREDHKAVPEAVRQAHQTTTWHAKEQRGTEIVNNTWTRTPRQKVPEEFNDSPSSRQPQDQVPRTCNKQTCYDPQL